MAATDASLADRIIFCRNLSLYVRQLAVLTATDVPLAGRMIVAVSREECRVRRCTGPFQQARVCSLPSWNGSLAFRPHLRTLTTLYLPQHPTMAHYLGCRFRLSILIFAILSLPIIFGCCNAPDETPRPKSPLRLSMPASDPCPIS